MAGKKCPNCGNDTFFKTPTGRKCSRCGLVATVPPEVRGKGLKCPMCGKFTVQNNKCRNLDCGAEFNMSWKSKPGG
ncbi:hypothetical protein R80B4_01043 [Fibrobacteres bacterium R8-0-B4]